MKNLSMVAAMTVCCFCFFSCKQDVQSAQEVAYASMKIGATDVNLSETYPASIEGRQDIAIFPQVSGTISRVCVTEGQRVKKGQSLFVIDQVPFLAALQMANANVEAAKASVATAKLNFDSAKELFAKKVISEHQLKTTENGYLTAKAGLAQAEAQQVTAKNNVTYTQVLSPADGVVGTIPYRVGALVAPNIPQPLTTVSDNSQMYVYYSLSEVQLLDLTAEHGSMDDVLASLPPVKLELANGKIYAEEGRVETISGVIDPGTGSVSVRAVFPNKGGILHSGASGRIVLDSKHSGVIMIPCSATFELQDLVFAYKYVDGKAVATRLSVKLSNDGKHYLVQSGLKLGDVIVTEGVGLIRDNQAITLK
ncbi:MAG: efflux RND transporter periplasmic adaptor subunit [Bacteroides sp.]|nr:efflux RND transporter periplasmic adaptor subunit [Bacteroides sp.]